MALRDITKNKAYIARQSANKGVDSLLNNIVNETSNLPQGNNNNTGGTVNGSGITAISAESFNRETGINTGSGVTTFQNGKVISQGTPYSKSYTSSNTIAGPTTANNLTRAQTTAQIGGRRQDLGMKNMEDIYDPLKKEEEKIPSFDYNTNLSNLYGKGLTDKSAIFGELSKDPSFASLDNIKQQEYITNMQNNIKDMNEAKARADMTNEQFDPAEYARLKGFDIQTGDVKEIQKGWKEITDTLKYQGTIYDNNAEDMKFKKEQTIKQLDQNIEQTKIQVNRQIDDVMRQSQQTIAMGEKVGALKGYNKSGGYVQGLMNIQQEAMKNIQRLQQDLARAEMLTGEDKALAMQEYEKNMTRAKEDFDYKMRSVIAEGQGELGRLVMGKYDPKKLGEMLDNLSYDVIQKRMDIEAQYINNIKSANDVVSQQFDQYRAMDDYTDKQRQEFTSILNANNGEALASMSAKDIENFVSQGMLSPEQGAAYYQSMVSKTIGALSEYGIPTQQDIDTIINSIKSGSAPLQAVAGVVQNNPNRYSSVKDKFMSVGANSSIFNTQTGQFITAPGATKGTTSQGGPTATPQTVQAVLPKYIGVKDGTRIGTGQCGEFVNDYIRETTGINYNMFVDPIDTRMLKGNSNTPTVGSVVIIDRRNDPKASDLANKYGHVGIVSQVNSDGTFNYKDQNGKNKLAVGTANNVKVGSNMRFFDPTKGMSAAQQPKSNVDDVYTILTNYGMADKIAEKNAATLSQQYTAEELRGMYPDKQTQQVISTERADMSKASENYNKSKQKLVAIQNVLNNPKASGKDIEVALKSFVSAIDNTAAMAGEVEQARTAGLSSYNALLDYSTKAASGDLSDKTKKQIKDTVDNFYKGIQTGYGDYISNRLGAIERTYGPTIAKQFAIYNENTPEKAKSNVAPVQSVLDKLATQALAKKGQTNTPTSNVDSTSLSARRSQKGK